MGDKMRILIDADACPVKEIAVEVAKLYNIEVIMFFDNSHTYEDDYSTVYILDKGKDSVDYFLLSMLKENDIVITQDYGLASLSLTKKCFPISQNGTLFSTENIDGFLNRRYINALARKRKEKIKGPSKRTSIQDMNFYNNLIKLIEMNL